MRTFILASILAAAYFLTSFGTQAQTEYRIDQPLPGDILKIQVFDGWNVRLVYDTVNMLSIATPCEYYFTEGNEPQICRQQADGWLSIWKNTSMPKGTLVEIHYRHSLQRLDVHPGATRLRRHQRQERRHPAREGAPLPWREKRAARLPQH